MSPVEQVQARTDTDFFITVPDTILPSGVVVPSFQVGQYACTEGRNGKAAVSSTDKPWTAVSYYEAVDACSKAGCKLITERQWLALAWNVSQQDCNWSAGKVGQGKLFLGINNWNVNQAQAGNFQPAEQDEHRWLTLSNGEPICDLNGNFISGYLTMCRGMTEASLHAIFITIPSQSPRRLIQVKKREWASMPDGSGPGMPYIGVDAGTPDHGRACSRLSSIARISAIRTSDFVVPDSPGLPASPGFIINPAVDAPEIQHNATHAPVTC